MVDSRKNAVISAEGAGFHNDIGGAVDNVVVVAESTDQGVVAKPAIEPVVAGSRIDRVVAGAAIKCVRGGVADECVGKRVSCSGPDGGVESQPLDVTAECVAAHIGDNAVDTAAEGFEDNIGEAVYDVEVVPPQTDQGVVA